MKLTARQDIEANIASVYAQMVDFEQFERMAMRRGAEVERLDRFTAPTVGMSWRLKFDFRGKPRKLAVNLAELSPNALLDYGLDSPMFAGNARFELMELTPRRTRLMVATEIKPKTLAARLLVQSLRLAKRKTQNKYDRGVAALAKLLQERVG